MNEKQVLFCGNNEQYLSKELIAQSNDSNGGTAFRIPSLINAGGTLIAAIDKATSGADWGFIEIAIRRSEDGGETWSDIEVIATPPARETKITADCYASAFFIDPCMAIAPNGDVIMLVDFYPECKGLHNRRILDKKKAPYAMHEGKMRPTLYDRDGSFYIIRKDGVVLNNRMHETIYKVTDWKGSLYKGDEYVGNIFLNGKTGCNEANAATTFGAPLKRPKRNYIYMLRSSDKGKTWSDPVDITADFLIKSDGTFVGIAPGAGLTTKDGRVIMPLYVDRKETVSIYSVDNGESWHRMTQQPYSCNIDEWQLVEAPDETVVGLGRQKRYGKTPLSLSYNHGKYWEKGKKTNIFAPKCQKSVIAIGKYVFCSHASKSTRADGVITVGRFKKAKGKTVGIDWYTETQVNNGFFAYSCLTQIDDEYIGILYEEQPSSYICFKKYKISDLI